MPFKASFDPFDRGPNSADPVIVRWLILCSLLAGTPLLGGCHLLFPFNAGAAPDDALTDGARNDTGPPPDALIKRDNLIKRDGPIQQDGAAAPSWKLMAPTGMAVADTNAALKIWGVNATEIYISTGKDIHACSDANPQTTDLTCTKVFNGVDNGAAAITAMGGSSSSVYAVGGQGILRSKANGWGNISMMSTDSFNGLFCSGMKACLMVGTRDISGALSQILVSYDTGTFVASYNDKAAPEFNAVWSMGSTTAVACNGCTVFMKTPTLGWEKRTPKNCTHDLLGVWGAGEKEIHAVGAGGVRLRWDGYNWSMVGTGGGGNLNAIWGHGGTYYAVGNAGEIRIREGGSWSKKATFPGSELTGVWGLSADHVYVVGKGSKILRYH